MMRWHTPYAQYSGMRCDVRNPTKGDMVYKRFHLHLLLAHEEWAKYAREVYMNSGSKASSGVVKSEA